MKKVLAVALLGALALISTESTGRFISGNEQFATELSSKIAKDQPIAIRHILNKSVPDNSFVRVQGVILSQVDDDEYLFTDGTGKIKLEMEQPYFGGLDITHKDIITLRVKVDIDKKKVEIEAVEPIKLVGATSPLETMQYNADQNPASAKP